MNHTTEQTDPTEQVHHRQEVADFGIDLNRLEYLQSLTPQGRLENHERARQLVIALRRAGQRLYGTNFKNPPETARPYGQKNN